MQPCRAGHLQVPLPRRSQCRGSSQLWLTAWGSGAASVWARMAHTMRQAGPIHVFTHLSPHTSQVTLVSQGKVWLWTPGGQLWGGPCLGMGWRVLARHTRTVRRTCCSRSKPAPSRSSQSPGPREGSSAQGHRLRDALRGPPMGPPLMRLHPRISPAAPLGINTSLISRPDRPPHPEISTRLPVTAHKLPILRSAINTRFRTHLNSF